MADKPADGNGAKPKSKKLLIIILAVVLVVALAAGGAVLFFLMKGSGGEDEEGAAQATQAVQQAAPRTPPEYMPIDPIVINLADPGSIRYAQVGITLQLQNAEAANTVKNFLPSIRNGALRQISRRTSEELLRPEGKDQLAQDILELVRQETGLAARGQAESPVQAVLFSSLIIQ